MTTSRAPRTTARYVLWLGGLLLTLVGLLLALLSWLTTAGNNTAIALSAHRVRPVAVRGRDPDPPSLTRLSIQRC